MEIRGDKTSMRKIDISFIMAIVTSILKDKTKTLIVSPDEKSSREAIFETEKLLKQSGISGLDACTYEKDNQTKIKFKNGSFIEFVSPVKDSDVIRGRRSELPMLFYDYEYCNQDEINEVLEPFIRNDNTK